jgi:hypothetical protein
MPNAFDKLEGTQHYERATMRAFWQGMIGLLRGKPAQLLSYDDIKTRLRLREESYAGLQEVILEKIVGSVGRYQDFTENFLPKGFIINKERWTRIYIETTAGMGLPPIEVYQIGEQYFVRDGNHRVSVARALGNKTIQAYVTVVDLPECVAPLLQAGEMDAAAAYIAFLDDCALRTLVQDESLLLTEPSRYGELMGHLRLHHAVLEASSNQTIWFEDAAAHWYNEVYQPAGELMRAHDMLSHARQRTEADLFLWLVDHLQELEQTYHGHSDDLAPALVSFLEKRALPVPQHLQQWRLQEAI